MTDPIAVSHAAVHFRAAVPTFLVADVGRTADWYTEQLGFHVAGTVPDRAPYAYASLQRDDVELMLLQLSGYQKPDLTARRPEGVWDAYVRMHGVHAFFETVRGREFVRASLNKRSYGDWEFEVLDPNGYILVFSERTD
jgi:catechol 2,3-dioxygenase-like lactoylglutathione lyase family enzyme